MTQPDLFSGAPVDPGVRHDSYRTVYPYDPEGPLSAPAMQFYVKDWISSTKNMGAEAKGVYIDLLTWAWDNGPLPKSEDERARIGGVSVRRFRSIWLAVGPRWIDTARGYVNAKQEEQREALQVYRRKQSEAGKRSAEVRLKATNVEPPLQPEGNQRASLHSALCSLPSALTPKSKTQTKTVAFDPPEFAEFYARYPRRINRKAALKAWRGLRPDDVTIAAIHTALDWQTLQPDWLKDRGKFVPYPASWINNRRWEDEPTFVPGQDDDPNAAVFDRVLRGSHGDR